MRICIVYDCLFPCTVGGAERWYRHLAERLAQDGHEVTYYTLKQWEGATPPDSPAGVRVVAVGSRAPLYTADGRRRAGPPLLFGLGVLARLLREGGRYDVVHTCSFPYFPLLAAAAVRPFGRYRVVVDWFEFWSEDYWRDYLGPLGGRVGWCVQRLCLQAPQHAFVFARLTAGRLKAAGLRWPVSVLGGLYAGPQEPAARRAAEPVVVSAGRQIPEKRTPAVVHAVAQARRSLPQLRARILGDGPERPAVLAAIAEHGLESAIEAPGFVPTSEVQPTIGSALCLLHPSSREGYGLVVVEAAAAGTPVVLAAGTDNAATELVEEGVNGFVALSASPEDLSGAILRVHQAGDALRASTQAWFVRNAERLSLESSISEVSAVYAGRSG